MSNVAASVFEVASDSLPIYRLGQNGSSLFYTPGFLAVVGAAEAASFASRIAEAKEGVAGELRTYAEAAVQAYEAWFDQPYLPTCLTLYLNDGCNLRCTYCLCDPSGSPTQRLELAQIRSAAELVARNCQIRSKPLTVVLHGGGEPTLEPDYLFRVLDAVETVADRRGIAIWKYLATNGVMSNATAERVARGVDVIGLSCDGPESVQALQRPLRSGGSSTARVEATADIIRAAGTDLHVRTTVLPESAAQLPVTAQYICERIRPTELSAEPVYLGGRTSATDLPTPDDVGRMVEAFLGAEAVAVSNGVAWRTSGSRLGEIHGPYCNIFRDVLNLVPGGEATACFKTRDTRTARSLGLNLSGPGSGGKAFALRPEVLPHLRRQLSHWPSCDECFNRFHCARGCPDECPATEPVHRNGFRCGFQKLLTTRRLQAFAASQWPSNGAVEVGIVL